MRAGRRLRACTNHLGSVSEELVSTGEVRPRRILLTSKKEKPFALDMSKAAVMEPIPDNTKTLCAISDWDARTSSGGNPILHVEATIVKPDKAGIKNRKLFDDINLQNEYTLGRLLTLLKGLGFSEEEARKMKDLPAKEDMVGTQFTCVVGIRVDETGKYGDRNTMKRILPAAAFEA